MSFWDDLTEYGSGLLDDVGEGFNNLIDSDDDSSKNAGTTQQPQQPVKDNHGNAVTGSPQAMTTDNTLLYVGGGLGLAVLVTVLVVVLKK